MKWKGLKPCSFITQQELNSLLSLTEFRNKSSYLISDFKEVDFLEATQQFKIC